MSDHETSGEKKLRLVVFLTGLFEFSTSFLLLFLPALYKKLFAVEPAMDNYFIRQIGMFEFLVGGAILWFSFDADLRPGAILAIWFHVACLPFEAAYAVDTWQDKGLFPWSMAFFVVFHIVMLFFLIPLFRKQGYRLLQPVWKSG